jgi:putative transposase
MPEYRRMHLPGGVFFLTWVTYERRPLLRSVLNVSRLRSAVAEVRRRKPFEILGAVILPDHVHLLWELPPGDGDFSTRVGMIKRQFTRSLGAAGRGEGNRSDSRRRHRESALWQRRFWEHTIRDDRDFATHMDYIHYNPVRHGCVSCPHAWPYSSFHRWVREGHYDADWACCCQGRRVSPLRFDEIAARVGE